MVFLWLLLLLLLDSPDWTSASCGFIFNPLFPECGARQKERRPDFYDYSEIVSPTSNIPK